MRLQVTIEGMLAVHARHAVFTALGAVQGITRAEVELGRADVELALEGSESETAVRAAIRDAIEAAGFHVSDVRSMPRTLPTLEH